MLLTPTLRQSLLSLKRVSFFKKKVKVFLYTSPIFHQEQFKCSSNSKIVMFHLLCTSLVQKFIIMVIKMDVIQKYLLSH